MNNPAKRIARIHHIRQLMLWQKLAYEFDFFPAPNRTHRLFPLGALGVRRLRILWLQRR